MVCAIPDITHFKLLEQHHDFILIASDGVFDRLSTEEVVGVAWNGVHEGGQGLNEACGSVVERVMRASMIRESLDNLSVVMIAFKGFVKALDT